ncbi:TspO/MBR family protein [Ferrovum myxofaciens]|uniref:Tryptophan-rich sensory protein n=1 Tax=Ferrovum myxofaciens TaxID=416213 RepID=A0A9E6MVV9_9PROT|nr:TspO/MBR family protein [Ferrovum myxofaciens]QKE39149.1 MAG: tryptophan-rich sensory protein [Ferrovum myxofaciens]QWY74392.1 MAG: tryptophan-rich sensory protein [Ferrovum myxofaciens]QWY77144.1 MAG: tryptophan-rich sensory protein [Ferrovum myxofaciens]
MNKTGGFPGLACGASKDVKRRSRISRPLALKQETSLARDMRLVFVDQESLPFPCLHGSQKLRAGRMSRSWLFFNWNLGVMSLADIVILAILIVATLISFRRVNPLAGMLLIPYLLWVSFALTPNYSLWQLNPLVLH